MNFNSARIGMNVVRSKGDYVVGRTGDIVELDADKCRCRVAWKNNVKTWVKAETIEPTSIPYDIITVKAKRFTKSVYVKLENKLDKYIK